MDPEHTPMRLFLQAVSDGKLVVTRGGVWKRAGSIGADGYVRLSGSVDQQRVSVFEHRLIWEIHNGPIPHDMQINHKNGDKTDNSLENLELVTASENQIHSRRVLNNIGSNGIKHFGPPGPTQSAILEALKEEGHLRPMRISEVIGKSRVAVRQTLRRMTREGRVKRHPDGSYTTGKYLIS